MDYLPYFFFFTYKLYLNNIIPRGGEGGQLKDNLG